MSNLAIRSFASGELAPALYARTDLARYENGLRTCRNYVIMRQGGVTKRPGTQFIARVKDSTKRVRLVPFVFNVRQAFALEFGDRYVRFYQNAGRVLDDDATTILEVASPYLEADLASLQYVQAGDVLTIVHPSYPPYELQRHSNTEWTLTPIVFGTTVPTPTFTSIIGGDPGTSRTVAYVVTGVDANGDESLASDPITHGFPPKDPLYPIGLTATFTGDVLTANVYRQDNESGVYGFIFSAIVEAGTITVLDYGTIPDLTLQPPIDKSSTLFNSADNYPSVVAYYQQRLIFANTNTHPDTVWCSRTALYHNFNTSVIVQDDDAITFRLVSDEVDAIRHVLNLGRLIIGTEGVDWIVEGDGNGTLTPIAVNSRVGSYDGMAALKPIKTGAHMLFVQAMGAAVRELQSDVQFGTYSLVGGDVTVYSSHLVDGFAIVDWAFQQEPLHIVWAVRSDGVLLSLTYIPDQQVLGWARHDTDGYVENVCVIPEGSTHWLYLVVRRFVDGSYRRYVERMATTNVTPVFATPEAAAQGGIFTPPPPPGAPPPSGSPVVSPTSPSTTDVSATGATANWVFGNPIAPTRVEIRPVTQPPSEWSVITINGGLQSREFTGLTPTTRYEWRVAHVLGALLSDYLGPSAATTFITTAATQLLAAPPSSPAISIAFSDVGFTDITVSWAAAVAGQLSVVAIAGPLTTPPDEADYAAFSYAAGVSSAVQRITASGLYWVRVRYEPVDPASVFSPSAWAGPTQAIVTVFAP